MYEELNPYLLTIAVILFSDFEISKSENKTLLAKKISVNKITKRLIFFMASRFNRFDATNFENIFRYAKQKELKSFKNVKKLHFTDFFK